MFEKDLFFTFLGHGTHWENWFNFQPMSHNKLLWQQNAEGAESQMGRWWDSDLYFSRFAWK